MPYGTVRLGYADRRAVEDEQEVKYKKDLLEQENKELKDRLAKQQEQMQLILEQAHKLLSESNGLKQKNAFLKAEVQDLKTKLKHHENRSDILRRIAKKPDRAKSPCNIGS